MTVLHVLQSQYPWEVRVGKINRSLRRSGFQVVTVARGKSGQKKTETLDDTIVERVGVDGPSFLGLPIPQNPFWTRAIKSAIQKHKPQLILVREIPLVGCAVRAANQFNIPVILDMAEHYPEAMRSWKKYSENFFLRLLVHDFKVPDFVEKKAVASVAGIVVVCEEQKERLIGQYGFRNERIAVVKNTPELGSLKGGKREPEIRGKRICFGYHGILCEDRELEVVLNGFDIAAKIKPEIELLLAGSGESESGLRELARKLTCSSRIEFTGRYSPEELPALYARADFGIVSLRKNIFTENTLANKFFDYAALGKPFIYPSIAPLERVMKQMKCGISFTPGNAQSVAEAIFQILEKDYQTMSVAGVRSFEMEFNWGHDEKVLIDFLKNQVKNSS